MIRVFSTGNRYNRFLFEDLVEWHLTLFGIHNKTTNLTILECSKCSGKVHVIIFGRLCAYSVVHWIFASGINSIAGLLLCVCTSHWGMLTASMGSSLSDMSQLMAFWYRNPCCEWCWEVKQHFWGKTQLHELHIKEYIVEGIGCKWVLLPMEISVMRLPSCIPMLWIQLTSNRLESLPNVL